MTKMEAVMTSFIKIFTVFIPRFFHRLRNKNKDFTIISRNCLGGIIYSQYGMKFLSPTINLFFSLNDFNYFCLYLNDYINGNLIEDVESNLYYPVGIICPINKKLPPIKVNFLHYKTFNDGQEKWNERKKRINWNNIYVVDSCPYNEDKREINAKIIASFNNIPYKKVFFSDIPFGFDNEQIIDASDISIFRRISKYSWKYPFNSYDLNSFFKK